MYAVFRNDGTLVSTGTVVADPLPDGLSARLLTDHERVSLATGGAWDVSTRTVREPAPAVPESVTPWQIRRWLLLRGVTAAHIDALIASIGDDATREAVRIDWEYAERVERSHPLLPTMAHALGVDDLDMAFVEAAQLGGTP